MNKDIEKLVKVQNKVNKNRYHLWIQTDLEDNYRWALFQYMPNTEDYFSKYNGAILTSTVDSLDDLINYLEKHDGFNDRW